MIRGRNRDAMALKEGIEAARMPMLISMTDQYIAPLMAQVASSDQSIWGMYVMRIMEETQALENFAVSGVSGVR